MTCDTCMSMIIKPLKTVSYQAVLTDLSGCTATSETTLRVSQDERVYIPNIFAPQGQNVDNQRFTIFGGPDVARINSLIIVDRWGELMYEKYDFPANDLSAGWDGQFYGKTLNPAVFLYSVEVEFINGDKVQYRGDVTLVE